MRIIELGVVGLKESTALRELADNLDKIEELQKRNAQIWQGIATAANKENEARERAKQALDSSSSDEEG